MPPAETRDGHEASRYDGQGKLKRPLTAEELEKMDRTINEFDKGYCGDVEVLDTVNNDALATEAAPAEAAVEDEPVDNRPVWDIEYAIGDGGGVTEIHADSADEARAAFVAQYPEDRCPTILSVEPG